MKRVVSAWVESGVIEDDDLAHLYALERDDPSLYNEIRNLLPALTIPINKAVPNWLPYLAKESFNRVEKRRSSHRRKLLVPAIL